MSKSISCASEQIQNSMEQIRNLEREFNQITDEVARNWNDNKQREFYDKHIRELSEALKNATNDLNSISFQVKSIETKLNAYN
jgi:uncharacterized protein (UPF0335 family)